MMWCALVLVILAAFLDIAELKVLVQPIGRVAYPGTTVHYSCEGTTTGSALLSVNDELVVGRAFPNTFFEEQYQNRQFSWTRTPPQGGGTVRWDLSVLANEENNNTRMSCTFNFDITRQAVLVVVNGPPGPPAAPTVQPSNLTVLTLTWTAPWTFPVTNYTVTMLNLTSNQITQWTATEERHVLTKEQESGQCDELVFTVEAETDVGSTGPSTNTTSGFPKSITPVNQDELNLQMRTFVQDRAAVVQVEFQSPIVCYNQNLSYKYSIIDLDNATLVLSETSSYSTNVSLSGGILYNVQYALQLTVMNSDWESDSLRYNFTINGDCQLQVRESVLPENCSLLSSSAVTSLDTFFNQSSCALFGELDFTNLTSNASWDSTADTCITESMILQRLLLREHSQPHPLTESRCQSYSFLSPENTCQYRMDCLLRFTMNASSDQYGYIHLRNISSDQVLYEAAVNDLFNVSQNTLFLFSNTSKECPKAVPIEPSSTSTSISPSSVTNQPTPAVTGLPLLTVIIGAGVTAGVLLFTLVLLLVLATCCCCCLKSRKLKREIYTVPSQANPLAMETIKNKKDMFIA